MSRSFAAKYPGVCANCDGQIVVGQQVGFMDDELIHVKCPKPEATCPVCFMVLPASGLCGVCDDD